MAGVAGGRTLRVPPRGTRPTSDRVREALFSRLEHAGLLDGTRVLDLYAGSGALGLEAASRGAAAVVLVESARAAVRVCRENVATLALPGVRVVGERVLPWLRAQRSGPEAALDPVDLALVDPPYDLPEPELTEVLTALGDRLAPDGVVVVERSTRAPEPTWPAVLERTDRRRYGETVLWFADVVPDHDREEAGGRHGSVEAPGTDAP